MTDDARTNLETATLGGGCFWCLDAAYRQIAGVTNVVSGYAGGARPNPSYEQVCTGVTGHAEVVQITYDPQVIAYPDILDIFFTIHNPTQLNFQGNDYGTQYRSIILYETSSQQRLAQAKLGEVQRLWQEPVVTQLVPLEAFYPAEDEHQDYFHKHPAAAYCQIIINPKLAKLREKFQARLKPELR